MVKFERPRIGIISDSPLQRHLLQHLLEAYGVEVLFNLDPERYQKPLAPIATDFDILLIEVENEDHCADFIDEILENTEAPVLFGLGKAPERQSKEYPRWERSGVSSASPSAVRHRCGHGPGRACPNAVWR